MSEVREYILSELKSKVTFRNKRRLVDVASDCLQLVGKTDKEIAIKADLSPSTVKRLRTLDPSKSGAPYRPNALTIEKVLEASNAQIEIVKNN